MRVLDRCIHFSSSTNPAHLSELLEDATVCHEIQENQVGDEVVAAPANEEGSTVVVEFLKVEVLAEESDAYGSVDDLPCLGLGHSGLTQEIVILAKSFKQNKNLQGWRKHEKQDDHETCDCGFHWSLPFGFVFVFARLCLSDIK